MFQNIANAFNFSVLLRWYEVCVHWTMNRADFVKCANEHVLISKE